MKAKVDFDFNKVPQGEEFRFRVMLSLSGEAARGKKRPDLNLALVLDRSGSMAGLKLEHVKLAAGTVLERLASHDRASLTVFDTNVDVIIPTSHVRDITAGSSLMENITAGSSTFLSGGYEKGFESVRRYVSSEAMTRVVLLTDGLANIGITDREALARIAAGYHGKGVSTTTIGAGEDYDEALLASLAECGRGNTYFIENPDDAVSVFTEELGYLLELTATNCQAKVVMNSKGGKASQLNTFRVLDNGSFDIGDLYTGQTKQLLLEVAIPAQGNLGPVEVGSIEVSAKDLSVNPLEPAVQRIPLVVEVVSKADFEKTEPNTEVTVHAALVAIAGAKSRAMKLANNGQFAEASAELTKCIKMLEQLNLRDPRIVSELELMRTRAREIGERGVEYYTPVIKKRMFYEQEMTGKGRLFQYDAMIGRRPPEPPIDPTKGGKPGSEKRKPKKS